MWYKRVNTFLELKTNHRFQNDVQWGKLLERYHPEGPSKRDIKTINTQVLGLGDGKYFTEKDLPYNLCYAVKTNLNQNAINDAIFKKVIEETHFKDLSEPPPKFTICIKALQMTKKVNRTKQTYRDIIYQVLQNIVHACCGNVHIGGGRGGTQHYDPLLNLYIGCLVMITENLDIQNLMANGSMCISKGLKLTDPQKTMECINIIDGYYVNCVETDDIEYTEVELQEHK